MWKSQVRGSRWARYSRLRPGGNDALAANQYGTVTDRRPSRLDEDLTGAKTQPRRNAYGRDANAPIIVSTCITNSAVISTSAALVLGCCGRQRPSSSCCVAYQSPMRYVHSR